MRTFYRFALTIFLLLGCHLLFAQSSEVSVPVVSDSDSLKYVSLDNKLEEYCSALRCEPVSVQVEECDFLIETCKDSLVRQHVAVTLYRKYRSSKIMGVETVAINILDKWFFSGKVSFPNQIEQLDARIYADFNRQSLVGNKAPEITMYDMDGTPVSLFDSSVSSNAFKVLFFYDAQCSKCKVETILLRNLLENEDFPVEFYAIYSGFDEQAWKDYVALRFDMKPRSATITHLWDPDLESDFQRKYGVLQTPRLYLIAPDNVIIGRSLDVKSLAIMLQSLFEQQNLEYGSDRTIKMLDSVLGSDVSFEQLKYFADHLAQTALPKGDTLSFRQMAGDLLYYLSSRPSESGREGLAYLIDNYILSRGDIWKSNDDSLKVVGMAQIMNELLSKSEPGSKIVPLKVPGELFTPKKVRSGKWNLRKLRGDRNIIIFYTDGCPNCDAQKQAAHEFLTFSSARRSKVLLVNVDQILSTNSNIASTIFDEFDLSTLPHIIITDKHGTILRRYVSLL